MTHQPRVYVPLRALFLVFQCYISVSSHNVNMAEEEEVDMESVMCAPGITVKLLSLGQPKYY